jgi:hypothetical protein
MSKNASRTAGFSMWVEQVGGVAPLTAADEFAGLRCRVAAPFQL